MVISTYTDLKDVEDKLSNIFFDDSILKMRVSIGSKMFYDLKAKKSGLLISENMENRERVNKHQNKQDKKPDEIQLVAAILYHIYQPNILTGE